MASRHPLMSVVLGLVTLVGTGAARRRLQAVLDQLPADAQLPFAPRSKSAFKLRGVQN